MKYVKRLLLALLLLFPFEGVFADRVSKQRAREIVETGKLVSLMNHEEGNNWARSYNLYLFDGAYFVCLFNAGTKGYEISCNDMVPKFVD